MKPTNLFFLICLTINCTLPLSAQKYVSQWGELTKEEISKTVYEADPDVAAVILVDKGHYEVKNNNSYSITYHKRIKILKREGFEEGDVSIPYQQNRKRESLRTLKAQIILPDGKRIALAPDAFFEEKISGPWYACNFTFPRLEVGAIIEYEYEMEFMGAYELQDWNFQSTLPVIKSELILTTPGDFVYDFHFQNVELDQVIINNKELTFEELRQSSKPGKKIKNTYQFIKNNVPALQEEPYRTALKDYYAKLKIKKALLNGNYAKNSWDPAIYFLIQDKHFGKQYLSSKKSKEVVRAIRPIIKKIQDKEEKIRAIYSYLLEHIKIVEKGGFGSEQGLNQCFKEKMASSAELNLMMIAILKQLKIAESWPVLISTRDHGRTIEDYITLNQFNHVLAYVNIDGKEVVLDLSDKWLPFGHPAISSLNGTGLLIASGEVWGNSPWNNKFYYEWINIDRPLSSETFVANCQLSQNGTLSSKIELQYKGYASKRNREILAADPTADTWTSNLTKNSPASVLTDMVFKNKANSNQSLEISGTWTLPEIGQVMGSYMYVKPIFYPTFSENPFKKEVRQYEVDLPYPIKERQVLSITIPDGYQIEELPPSQQFKLLSGSTMDYAISSQDNIIRINYIFELNKTKFGLTEYKRLKEMFDITVEKLEEQIVLRKTDNLVNNK